LILIGSPKVLLKLKLSEMLISCLLIMSAHLSTLFSLNF
jgi:hypothetical protein